VTWGAEAVVARPPHAVFLRGDKSEVESNDGCGEAPRVVVLTARQPATGLDLVLSLCRVVSGVAVALRRWIRMVVASLVQCYLFLLVPYRCGATRGGNDDCMSVRLLGSAAKLAWRCCERVSQRVSAAI
jgi:hypothetical protein